MLTPPREPSAGDRLSASFMREIVRYVRALNPVAGPGVRIRQSPNGTVYEADAQVRAVAATEATRPFAIRYVEQDAAAGVPYTGWEIYLPAGCVALPATAGVLNLAATRLEGGETKTLADWYRVPYPDATPEDGDAWYCDVHVKPSAAVKGVDAFADWPKTYAFAKIYASGRTTAEIDADTSTLGDALAFTVARILFEADDDGDVAATVRRTTDRNVYATYNRNAAFELVWYFERTTASNLELTLDNLYVRNACFNAAGLNFATDTLREITKTHEEVYLKVSAGTSPYTGEIRTYADADRGDGTTLTVLSQVEAERGASSLLVRLYKLKNGKVVTDERATALANLQVYAT